jgi:thioredoxin 1
LGPLLKRKTVFALLLALCAIVVWAHSEAQATSLTQGIDLYKKGDYRQATAALEKAVVETPYDASAHLYLALCYKELKQDGPARQHFNWVINSSKDNRLRAYANSAMHGMRPARSSSSTPDPGSSGEAGSKSASAAPAKPKRNLGRCKVIMFETSWCKVCHQFAPEFDATSDKYRGKMDFQRLDAEQHPDMRDRYGVRVYPTLVYLDGHGNVLDKTEGAYGLQRRVQALVAESSN